MPLVEFRGHAGTATEGKTRRVLLEPERWEIGQPTVVASRTQLPLRLAWGMTVHAAQGLTIDRLQVDLGRVFADGQACLAPTHSLLLATHYSLLTTHYSLLTTHYSLLTTHYLHCLHCLHYLHNLLLTTYCSPLTAHHSPLTSSPLRCTTDRPTSP